MVRTVEDQDTFLTGNALPVLLDLLFSVLQQTRQHGIEELEVTSVRCTDRRPFRYAEQTSFEIWGCLHPPRPASDRHLKIIDEALSSSGLQVNSFRLDTSDMGTRVSVLKDGLFASVLRMTTRLDLKISAEDCGVDEIVTATHKAFSCCAPKLKHLRLSTENEKNVEEPCEEGVADEAGDDWSIMVSAMLLWLDE